MKTLQMTASAVALGALALSAGADTTAAWWNLDFNDITTSWTDNEWEISGVGSFNRSSAEDVSAVTPTYKDEQLDSAALELNTNGGDLVFTPAPGTRPDSGAGVVVDADVFFIPSEQDPTITDDLSKPVKAALYLYANPDSGDDPKLRAYTYSYDQPEGAPPNVWTALDYNINTNDVSGGVWLHVQITYDGGEFVTYKIGEKGADLTNTTGQSLRRANNPGNTDYPNFNEVVFKGTGLVDNFVGKSLSVAELNYEYLSEVATGDVAVDDPTVDGSTATFSLPLMDNDSKPLTRIEVIGVDGATVTRTITVAVDDGGQTATFTEDGNDTQVGDSDGFDVDITAFIESGEQDGTQFTVLKLYYGSSEPPAEEEWDPVADQTKLDTELASGFTAISEGGENPVEFDAQAGFTVKFVPATPGLYELIAVSSVDADFRAGDPVDSQTVSAADVTAETPVELSDATTAGSEAPAARFYKIRVSGSKE